MIRLARAEDLPELARIHALCFVKAWDAKALGELLESAGIIALFATHGFVLARVAADEAEILTVAVEPAARRRGLARALLGEAALRAASRGAATMFLEVGAANRAGRALYGALGFSQAGSRKSYYEHGEDALILKRDLPLAPRGIGG
ncbi:MAG TPA: GNAT family N-acetyltransferase [Rhizomicrobium sp.]|nr:GNAT family N-acetyltransferase [Rhizomicrobium sp.]